MPSEVSLFDGRWFEKPPPPPPAAGKVVVNQRPYLSVPDNMPNSPGWNLEARNMTSPDLAENGWIVQRFDAPYEVFTRLGPIPAYGTTGVPFYTGLKYYSSLVDGVLQMLIQPGIMLQIYKPVPMPPPWPNQAPPGSPLYSASYRSHVWNSYMGGQGFGDGNYLFISDWPNYRQAGQFVYAGNELDHNVLVFHSAPSTWGVPLNRQELPFPNPVYDNIKSLDYGYSTGTWNGNQHSFHTTFQTAPNGQIQPWYGYTDGVGYAGSVDVAYAGILIASSTCQVVNIDFIRRSPWRQFPV